MKQKQPVKLSTESADSDRRRLLKASAAAPLIATLAPNSASAMASMSCEQKTVFSRAADGAYDAASNGAVDPQLAGGFVRRRAERFFPAAHLAGTKPIIYRVPADGISGDGGLWAEDGQEVYPGDITTNDYPDYPNHGQEVWVARYYHVGMAGDDAQANGFYPQLQLDNQPLSGSCLGSIDPHEPTNPFVP